MKTGEQLKISGIEKVEDHNHDFMHLMRSFARSHSQRHGSVTSDDIRKEADRLGVYPKHPNAYGAIFRGPGWVPIGRTKSKRPEAHARSICVWKFFQRR